MGSLAERFNAVFGIFGQRGSGKTDYLRGNPEHNLVGIMNIYAEKGMKVLIADTFDHPSYRNVPVLPMDKIASWKSGIYRVIIRPDDIAKLCKLINTTPSMWNTLIVFEDAYKHTSKTICKPMVELMIDSKQKNIDICFMYHAFMQAPADLYRFIDFMEIFKTKDTPEARKEHMPGYFEEAMHVYKIVKASTNKFFHKLLKTDLNG